MLFSPRSRRDAVDLAKLANEVGLVLPTYAGSDFIKGGICVSETASGFSYPARANPVTNRVSGSGLYGPGNV